MISGTYLPEAIIMKDALQGFYTAFISDTATEKVSCYWNQLVVNNME